MDKDDVGREVVVIINDVGKVGGCLTALTCWRDEKAIFRCLICGEDMCRTAADGIDNRLHQQMRNHTWVSAGSTYYSLQNLGIHVISSSNAFGATRATSLPLLCRSGISIGIFVFSVEMTSSVGFCASETMSLGAPLPSNAAGSRFNAVTECSGAALKLCRSTKRTNMIRVRNRVLRIGDGFDLQKYVIPDRKRFSRLLL